MDRLRDKQFFRCEIRILPERREKFVASDEQYLAELINYVIIFLHEWLKLKRSGGFRFCSPNN